MVIFRAGGDARAADQDAAAAQRETDSADVTVRPSRHALTSTFY